MSPELVTKWTKAEKKAMEKRGTYLKVYDVRHVKGKQLLMSFSVSLSHHTFLT